MTAKIIGTGSYLPDNIVSNDFLSTIVDTSDEWISSRTGIKNRRISMGEGTTDMAVKASLIAVERALIKPEDIDLVLVATMSADSYLPNTACQVQSMIGAVNAICFDINAACAGFVFAIQTAQAYMSMDHIKHVLVIGAETVSRILDWEDRSTCVLFGDGAGAVVLKKDPSGMIHTILGSDGSKGEVLTCKTRNIINPFVKEKMKDDFMKMDGQEVFKFAVKKVPDCIQELLRETNIEVSDIKYFVLHQANKRILESVAKRLKVDIDRFPMNLNQVGNTSAASIPILLDELNQQGKLNTGDKIIISGFGGGLTWGASLIEW